jgi:hypothetical protein
MQETHDDLLRIRHTLYAHRDLTRTIAWNPATQTSEAMHERHKVGDNSAEECAPQGVPMNWVSNSPHHDG